MKKMFLCLTNKNKKEFPEKNDTFLNIISQPCLKNHYNPCLNSEKHYRLILTHDLFVHSQIFVSNVDFVCLQILAMYWLVRTFW